MDAVEQNPAPLDVPRPHTTAAPMKQVVYDLETWGLDRGWGVTLVGSFMVHGKAGGVETNTFALRDYEAWKNGKRSDDKAIVKDIFELLKGCHISYAHNGEFFDSRWLRTVALKYGLEMPRIKLVDPCAIAWRQYRIGRNSLEAVSDFLGIEKQKMHIPTDVWRYALMDDAPEAWDLLIKRCESDVDLLNEVAARVTGDVGMIDYQGSARR
jgi:DNA polymerase III epsilon subunit-like protein